MASPTTYPNPYPPEEFVSARNLDRADEVVAEIFAMMFGFDVIAAPGTPDSLPPMPMGDDRTAVVGFSGAMRGACQVRVSTSAARSIASAMLGGAPIDDDDDSVNDALGELCNMLAGGWKNGVPGLSSECTLSPPTVITGHDYKVYVRKPSIQLARSYRFNDDALHLTLHLEDAEADQE